MAIKLGSRVMMKATTFKKQIPESSHLNACLDLLSRLGFVVWRSNAGGATYSHIHKTGIKKGSLSKYFVRYGFKGLPDICGYIPVRDAAALPLFWEVKRYGGKLKPDQRSFLEKAMNDGAFAGFGTVDDLQEKLKKEGFLQG